MTIWLDANLDPDLAPWLGSRFGMVTKHVREVGLAQASDRELFDAARRFGAIVIVTKDMDFVDLVTLLGAPPQIIRLASGNLSTIATRLVFERTLADALELLKTGAAWVEIV